MKNLDHALQHIATRYPFVPDKYPELATYTEGQRKKFAIKHSILHIAKSLGKLATVSENTDHGGSVNNSLPQEGIIKLVIDVLRLAEIQKLHEKDIYQEIQKALNA